MIFLLSFASLSQAASVSQSTRTASAYVLKSSLQLKEMMFGSTYLLSFNTRSQMR